MVSERWFADSRCPRCEGYEATYHTFEGECSLTRDDSDEEDVFAEPLLDEIAARRSSAANSQPCACGHNSDWHSHGGSGDCEHDGDCVCSAYEPANSQEKPQ